MNDLPLGELLQARPDWTTLTTADLVTALQRSSHKVDDLNRFLTSAQTWWIDDSATEDQRRARHRWLESVGDDFVRAIRDEGIAAMCREIDELDARLSFLGNLAVHDVGRHLIRGAVTETAERVRTTSPPERPDEGELALWTSRIIRLIEISGVSWHVDGLKHVLDALPEWLLDALMSGLGRLRYYENYYRELAAALCASTNEAVPVVLGRIIASSRTTRQTELISLIARASRDSQRGAAPPSSPSPEDARKLTTRIESSAPPDGMEQVSAILDSYRHHDREICSILSAYLSQVPSNHEDTVDFLSRHGTRSRGRALSSWGGPSVTISMFSSMRSSSPVRHTPTDPDAPSPDFDVRGVWTSIPGDLAVALIKAQRDPEFSLYYVSQFCQHPDFSSIAERVVGDPDCVRRWEHADPKYASIIWQLLQRPAYAAAAFEDLRWRLFPKLLKQFDVRSFPNAVHRAPGRFEPLIREELLARISHGPKLGDLRHLFDAAQFLENPVIDQMLANLDPRPLASVPADSEEREGWIYKLCRLLRDSRAVAMKIVTAIDPIVLETLVTHPLLSDDNKEALIQERLGLKARLVERWGAHDSAACRQALVENAQAHFDFMCAAGFDTEPMGHNPSNDKPLCPADEFLDVVAAIAPELVPNFAVGMLATGRPAEEIQRPTLSVRTLGRTIVRWLRRTRIDTADEVWNAAEHRVHESALRDDIASAAAVAALELPGDPARLRALRELAVRELLAAFKRVLSIKFTGSLRDLIDVLQRDAPELADLLMRR